MRQDVRLALGLTISIFAHGIMLFLKPTRLDGSPAPTASLNLTLLPASSFTLPESQATELSEAEAKPRTDTAPLVEDNQKSRFSKEGVFKINVDDYLPSHLLTSRPHPTDSIELTIDHFKIDGLVGEANLLVLIASNGTVDSVLVLESSLPDALVDYAANIFKKTKFVPGFINKHAVRSQFVVKLGAPAEEPTLDNQPESLKQGR